MIETVATGRTPRAELRTVPGDYPYIAAGIIADLGPALVAASGITAGDRVLDVAAGSGNAAIPAALAGAEVIASDVASRLFDAGRELTGRHGVTLRWEEGDAEALPYADGEFDAVISCVGVMFAPDHQRAADELVRVCRPGGTIGLLCWTPGGFIGDMFRTMRPYAPPPPPGAQPPPLWGDEDHVRALLGDRVTRPVTERRLLTTGGFASPQAWVDYWKLAYGPAVAVFDHIGADPAGAADLERDLAALAARYDRGTDTLIMDWEYLLLTTRKRT